MVNLICGQNEVEIINSLAERLKNYATVKQETEITLKKQKLPVYSFSFGESKEDQPCLIFVGGVHGLELIGSQLVVSYLTSLSNMLEWDQVFRMQLMKMKLIFYPCANPGGLVNNTRSNPSGIDIMRNAPLDGKNIPFYHLHSGQRYSKYLPWYRGKKKKEMEPESQALCRFIRREAFTSPVSLIVDIHSGFGVRDRIWFPYAYSKKVYPRLAEMVKFTELLQKSFPQNIYKIEPQCLNYRTHGDLWDFLFLEHVDKFDKGNIFLPLCLELGSWSWIRKNPLQIFSNKGPFHPVVPHRHKRILRRHLYFFDFLMRLVISHKNWLSISDSDRKELESKGQVRWYQRYNK
ncbi:MAG: zinc carboxypeptidase [Zetaproteobacteria bacterium]|nr:zinc carboxypeptidase [Pseudobdellovibrionaceae bacterium]